MNTSNNDTNTPLSEQTYYILLSLQGGPGHGYAIAKDVQLLSQERVVLSVSTLYTTLKRLLDDGWTRLLNETTSQTKRPRKIYELTELGGNMLREEVQRLDALIAAARVRGVEGAP